MARTEYGNARWTKTIRFGTVYDEYLVKGLFVEVLSYRFKPAVYTDWVTHPTLDFHQLSVIATSSAALGVKSHTRTATVADQAIPQKGGLRAREVVSTVTDHDSADLSTATDLAMDEMLLLEASSPASTLFPSPFSSTTTSELDSRDMYQAECCRVGLALDHQKSTCPMFMNRAEFTQKR